MKALTMVKCGLALLAWGLTASATAGPFGLEQGMTKSQIEERIGKGPLSEDEPKSKFYRTEAVPNSHPTFKEFSLFVDESLGLCKIIAAGGLVSTSVYGEDLKSHFEDVLQQLKGRYGESSKDQDFLMKGSIWNEPREWMRALEKGERVLRSFWKTEKKTPLPDNIELITLEANAASDEKGFVILVYEFSNTKECYRRLRKSRANVL